LLRTLRELPPGRVLDRLSRPLRGVSRRFAHAIGAGPGPVVPADLTLEAPPSLPVGAWTPPGRFELVGISRDLGSALDWTVAPTRLWAYQLHAIDALRENHPAADRLALLDSWLAANPFASRPGWEPYPASLRIVNTFEFLGAVGDDALAPRANALALQAWWIEANLETDLGANHLWKNAVALAWAGRCLRGVSPDRWRSRGDAMIDRELRAQILADGFHVERSPGYHAVLVDDLIRLERLLRGTGEHEGGFGRRVADARRRAAAALVSVLHPDGEIPLFNDAALGQAPPASWILDRAAELDGGARAVADPRGAPSAGFHRLAGERSLVLFDAGEIGCDDQPGHAHADTLTYEMSYGTSRVVVDAGVFDYEPSARRAYARGTCGHNTLELDGLDQSEMWGVFRVGRRARPLDVRREDRDGRAAIEASHDGYRHLAGSPVHRRRMEHLGGDAWRVEDLVHGGGKHRAVSRLRLHPAFSAGQRQTDWLEAQNGPLVVRVVAECPARLDVEEGRYFPSFGTEERCLVVRLDADGPLPLRIGYRLELSTRP
jgi:uncharacterized heparinase superfamily protein